MKIERFKIEPGNNQIALPEKSEILSISSPIDGETYIYVSYHPGGIKRVRDIKAIDKWEHIPDNSKYIGTYHQYVGMETYHVFDCGNLVIK